MVDRWNATLLWFAMVSLTGCAPYPWVGGDEQYEDLGCPQTTWFADRDGDGVGSDDESRTGCTPPSDAWVDSDGDCDDSDKATHVGALELCDGVDNDCDDQIDEGLPTARYFSDQDGDGFGDRDEAGVELCASLSDGLSLVTNQEDCDDSRDTVNPDEAEVCDGLDNDCDEALLPGEVDADGDLRVVCELHAGGWVGPGTVLGGSDCDDDDATTFPGNTNELCDGVANDCLALRAHEVDDDGDGYVDCSLDVVPWGSVTGGEDCDDGNVDVFPGAPELCDGADSNCDQVIPANEIDDDGDGFVDCTLDVAAWVGVTGGDDCNDADADNHPGNTEVCDGVDNDCDTLADDGLTFDWYPDLDGDGSGDENAAPACAGTGPGTWVQNGDDCNDEDASVGPGAPEICDGQDNDCDGVLPADESDDDRDGSVECTFDPSGWNGASSLSGDDCDDMDPEVYVGAFEFCDGKLNNCATGTLPVNETDVDGDGWVACIWPGSLQEFLDNWDGLVPVSGDADCDDSLATVFPGNPEVCDGLDNDCVGQADDGPLITFENWYPDQDGDGFGDNFTVPISACEPPPTFDPGTEPPNIASWVAQAGDCDDSEPSIHVGAIEHCDDTDWDCDGEVLDPESVDAFEYYRDADRDLYGNPYDVLTSCSTLPPTAEYVVPGEARVPPEPNDCDDSSASMSPALAEICDDPFDAPGLDNDCDGEVDENPALPYIGDQLYYFDRDGDGFGDDGNRSCTAGGGYVPDGGDCRDDDPDSYPGAVELLDGIDNDCDGDADASGLADAITWTGSTSFASCGWTLTSDLCGIASGGPNEVLVAESSADSGAGRVYLFEAPFVGGLAPDQARTVFRGAAQDKLTVLGDSGMDLTGDGVGDYLLAARDGQSDYMVVFIVPGPVPDGDVDPRATGIRITTDATRPIRRVVASPSVTADTDADLVIGTHFEGSSVKCAGSGWFEFARGSVEVFAGPFTADQTLADVYATVEGTDSIGALNYPANPGDLDGDGITDLVVAAPFERKAGDNECTSSGFVYVYLGPLGRGSFGTGDAALALRGPQAAWLGRGLVDAAHDLDGDGRDDLVVAGHYSLLGGQSSFLGSIFSVSGRTLFGASAATPAAGPPPWHEVDTVRDSLLRETSRAQFGFSAALGDVDQDGVVDLLAVRDGPDPVTGKFRAYLFRGPLMDGGTRSEDAAVRWWAYDQRFRSVRVLPDVDGSGRGELFFGVPEMTEAHAFPGEQVFGPAP